MVPSKKVSNSTAFLFNKVTMLAACIAVYNIFSILSETELIYPNNSTTDID